jgi:hypothetical protein
MKNLRLLSSDDVDFVTKIIMLLSPHGNELLLSKHPRLPIDGVVVNNDYDGYQGGGDEPA